MLFCGGSNTKQGAEVLFCHLKLSVLSFYAVRLQFYVFCCGSLQIILERQRHNPA